jgi:hypothetical protein
MNHHVQMWAIPVIALVVGFLLLLGVPRVQLRIQIGGYLFLCGLFILLWLCTFGSAILR